MELNTISKRPPLIAAGGNFMPFTVGLNRGEMRDIGIDKVVLTVLNRQFTGRFAAGVLIECPPHRVAYLVWKSLFYLSCDLVNDH